MSASHFPSAPFDLAKESDETLAKLAVQTENEWFSRMARRVLMERALPHTRFSDPEVASTLEEALTDTVKTKTDAEQLRALWALTAMSRLDFDALDGALHSTNEYLRCWAVRNSAEELRVHGRSIHLMVTSAGSTPPAGVTNGSEGMPPRVSLSSPNGYDSLVSSRISSLAKLEPSQRVRSELASYLQRLPNDQRAPIARALLAHGEDKDDPYIPLLIWYGIEPLVGADPKAGLELAKASKLPKVTEFIYRRMGAEEAGRTGLLTLAAETKDAAMRDALLDTVLKSARAGNKIPKPENWAALRAKVVSASAESKPSSTKVGATLTELEAFMGIEEAKQAFRTLLTDAFTPEVEKLAALKTLTLVRDAETSTLALNIVRSAIPPPAKPGDDQDVQHLRNPREIPLTRLAIQSLAVLPNVETSGVLVGGFGWLTPAEQTDAINTLATTAAGAKALLTAVKAKTIPSTALSPFLARQLAALNNAEVSALLKDTFGDLNAPKANLDEQKKKFRALLTKGDLAAADKAKGKVLFNAICGQCHQLFGEGQKVGPDLTGSNRGTLDYLLDNVLDPNAVIGKDYQLNLFELNDGRVASGVVKEETPSTFRIAMPGGLEQTITASEVKKRTVAKVSTMPEGLFDALPVDQLRQLVAYLQTNASPDTGKGGPVRKVEGALEGETLKVLETKGGKTKLQGMGGFGNKWSGGSQLWWTGAKPHDTLTLALPVAKPGKFAVKIVLTQARDYGIIDIALDGQPVLTDWDGFNADRVILSDELDLGTHDLTAGEHKLTFTLKGKNPAAIPSHMVGLDYVKLEVK